MYGSVISRTVASNLFGEVSNGWRAPDGLADAVPLRAFVAQMERARAASGDALYAWRAGETLPLTTLGALGDAMGASRTLGEALRRFAQGFPAVQSTTAVSFEVQDDEVLISYRILDPDLWPRQADAELTLSLIHTLCMQHGVPREAFREVSFEHAPSRDPADLSRYLGFVPGFCHDENRIAIPVSLLSNRARDGMAREDDGGQSWQTVLQRIVEQRRRLPTADRVRDQILRQVGRGSVAQAAVARELGMSERTLRRMLAAEGTSFHQILEACRRTQGYALLTRTDRRFSDIALSLGYSDQTAFSRAFSRWFGAPPSQIRDATMEAALT